mgnify:CR=1 FL=1
MFKKLNKKGFTLAELLVVVVIIGVLVAISIPIFTTQLEKSREAVDSANIRSAYAELSANVLTEEGAVTEKKEGNVTINAVDADDTTMTATITLTQKTNGWQGTTPTIGGMTCTTTPTAGKTATITVNRDGSGATLVFNS